MSAITTLKETWDSNGLIIFIVYGLGSLLAFILLAPVLGRLLLISLDFFMGGHPCS